MVLTQLQLKWPNHSTHLLTRLTYLFKNEQLVDCTLMCNKHSLKVHRSVLAACSPYFERELQNNPSIVVKDMQFSVLKALIEFMYYGETRITEENLTSLIEAAKIFEVKGLSEMDIVSGKNGIASSVVALADNDCIVESSCLSDDVDKSTFEATTILQQSLAHSTAATSTSMLDNTISSSCSTPTTTTTSNSHSSTSITQHVNHCSMPNGGGQSIYEDPTGSGDLMVESTSSSMPYEDQQQGLHSSRNFVVTPPQTESAQILLSLARSHNQKLFSSHIDSDGTLTNEVDRDSGFLNHNRHDGQANGQSVAEFDEQSRQQQDQQLQRHSINNSNILFDEHNLILGDGHSNGSGLMTMAAASSACDRRLEEAQVEAESGGKSLLAKLLTRNNHEAEQATTTYAKSTLYEVTRDGKVASNPLTAADLQRSIILECPFLIETTDGAYVDVCVENMLNSLDGSASVPVTIPMPSSEEPVIPQQQQGLCEPVSETIIADPAVLDRIRHDTAPELEIDPEAVVLTKISEDGRVEKYVLSSADVQALMQMNERLAAAAASASGRPSPTDMATEIETPGSSDSPLITKILVDGTGGIQNAINRLPFKKTVLGSGSASSSSSGRVENAADGLHQAILDSSLTVDDAHHHENMFEELDNQFNTMDCCAIDDEEHIRRDYVAYEEASKNETQLEHNYYANALKDEDEEGVVITDGRYDLRMMMMIEETPTTAQQPQSNDTVVAKSSNNKKRYQNVQLLGTSGPADICLNGNTLVSLGPSKTAPTTLRINGAGNVVSVDKPIIVVPPNGSGAAGKCDLIMKDALMSSVLNVVPGSTAAPLVKSNTPTTATKRKLSADNNVLPFKSVKSANTFRNSTNSPKKSSSTAAAKRTYNKRKTNASNHNQSKKMVAPLNGTFSNENNLIEEIIVDEIS